MGPYLMIGRSEGIFKDFTLTFLKSTVGIDESTIDKNNKLINKCFIIFFAVFFYFLFT